MEDDAKNKSDIDTNSEDQKPGIEEIQDRLDQISRRLERVESLIERIEPGIEEVSESAQVIREGFEFYDSMVNLMSKFTRAERLESRYGDLKKDDIAWAMIRTLDERGPLNISQITAGVRRQRGTASRRIVRQRVKNLLDRGIVTTVETDDDRATYYDLASTKK
ncbi:MAG: hypothetical protein R6V83_01585 [Candidatus Thorarchaeota archaeon]